MTNAGRSKNVGIPVYLGLGSNLGDREANLCRAIERITTLGLEIKSESSVYETEPVGLRDQPWFLNQVIETTAPARLTSEYAPVLGDPNTITTAQAETLLLELLKIEHQMGRERAVAHGPRVIDIDLLLFGELIIAGAKQSEDRSTIDPTDISVPHPRMHTRRFVLEPLCEIAPEIVHPVLKKTCRELLAALEDGSRVWISKLRSASASRRNRPG